VWREALGIPPSRRVVLFAGKFEHKKRPLDLLEAYRRVAPADATLLFVGNGPLEGELRRRVAGRPDVVFAPFQNQTAMPCVYAAGAVLVLPSYGPGETWGLAVNEAMCLGRPVIVSSHVGCGPDLVKPGETGLIFPAGDVAALADQIGAALADPDRLACWGRAASDHVRQYSYEQATVGLTSCLGWLAGRRPPRGRLARGYSPA
jgi:glycosyltransferase involved in cell wall biosynthesis